MLLIEGEGEEEWAEQTLGSQQKRSERSKLGLGYMLHRHARKVRLCNLCAAYPREWNRFYPSGEHNLSEWHGIISIPAIAGLNIIGSRISIITIWNEVQKGSISGWIEYERGPIQMVNSGRKGWNGVDPMDKTLWKVRLVSTELNEPPLVVGRLERKTVVVPIGHVTKCMESVFFLYIKYK